MNTGGSACKIDWGKIRGAIMIEHGKKLPVGVTAKMLEELCHADRPDRIYPILPIYEGAKNGGEPQVNNVGYGPGTYNGLNAMTDTFTLGRFDEMLNAKLLQCANNQWDVYYWDSNKVLYGYNDGTDVLAGIPMSSVYPTVTPYATSGAKSVMTVSFCHADAEDSLMNFDYVKLGFNPSNALRGLTEVVLEEKTSNKFKVYETMGGYDRTMGIGSLIASNVEKVMSGVTSATYDDGYLTIVPKSGETVALKSPSVLYESGIKWIEAVKTVRIV